MRNSGCHTGYFLVQMGTKQLGRGELQGRQLEQAPNWAVVVVVVVVGVVAAVGSVVLGMTAVHSKILEWHMADAAAAGCTGHLMVGVVVVVLRWGGWHMPEKEGQSWREHCMERVLHDAEGGDGAAADGFPGSSKHFGHCSYWEICWEQEWGGQGWWGSSVVEVGLHSSL